MQAYASKGQGVCFLPSAKLISGKRQRASRSTARCSATRDQDVSILQKLCRQALVTGAAMSLAAASMHVDSAQAYGLTNGRLEKCRGDMPCISTTSVGNPVKFGPPWSYQPLTDDADVAWAALKRAIEQNRDRGSIVESIDGPAEYYLRAEFPSSFRGIDDVEFRLVRNDALVTYRSASREAIFIYPLQTPINTDKNRTRLEEIRAALGWEEFGGAELYE